MAEEREGGWLDSWYKAAKNKSVEVLQFVKRDLDEFSTAVKSEASNVVSSTTSALKDKLRLDEPESTANTMKRSVSSFFGQVSSVLNPSPEDEDEEAIVIHDSQPVVLTKYQMLQRALVANPDTFLFDPDKKYEQQYEAWLEIIEDQLTADRLSKMMTANPDLHSQYTALVPDQVSHLEFWQRYLFRKALLEDEEARKEATERRAEKERQVAENFQWEQDDFGTNIELTEEEQTRLLLEYERECESKKLLRSNSERNSREDAMMSACGVRGNQHSSFICESRSEPSIASKMDGCQMTTSDKATSKQENLNRDGQKGELMTGDESVLFKTKEKKDMVIVTDGNSCHTSSSSGDKESNYDDWEREFDLEDAEVDTLTEQLTDIAKA
ncbi:BSD domain-containing protein 1-like isoform X2 [Zootermopsis nevadensis]|uniref:BSD domain-containing protein 1-like isoform X2 n=1 Tax=Zootermopsis nevadensis TaxID=136037 RepID=UPI000B8EE819|nr:BSD domain-containing protein 1-like isoform X2 [Zootermopsis nevadensis]